MKTLVKQNIEVVETQEGTLMSLLGQEVTFYTPTYIFAGILAGVNDECILIKTPKIVYETGPFNEKNWKDAQALPHQFSLMKSAIIGFGKQK